MIQGLQFFFCPNFANSFSSSGDTSEITPAWYAQAVWKGEKPSDVGASLKPGGSQVPSDEKELVRTIDHWNCLKVIHFWGLKSLTWSWKSIIINQNLFPGNVTGNMLL